MQYIKYYIIFDLNIDAVALSLNSMLKQLEKETCDAFYAMVERTYLEEKKHESGFKENIPKYTLIIIATKKPLTKKELLKAIKEMVIPLRGS